MEFKNEVGFLLFERITFNKLQNIYWIYGIKFIEWNCFIKAIFQTSTIYIYIYSQYDIT